MLNQDCPAIPLADQLAKRRADYARLEAMIQHAHENGNYSRMGAMMERKAEIGTYLLYFGSKSE